MKSAKRVGILITLTFCIASMMIMAGYQPAHSQANSTPIVTQSSRLAFVSRRDGNAQIYTVYPDGTNPLNVSKNKFNDIDPAWSPDGQHLAFASDRDGNNELCVMDADGSNQNCLTNNATTNKKPDKKLPEDRSPVWSPDNQRIAFISTRNGSAQIYAVNADGSNPLDLTNNPFNNSEPAWSPDLKQVAFVSSRDGNPEICVMDASGFNQRCLTNNRTPDKKPNPAKPQDISPAWSSDSQKLAFVSNRDRNKNPQIYVMNVDGSNPTNITKKLSADEQPAWSPDGAQIAFVSNREGARDIYVMNPDGSGQRRLLRTPRNEDVQPAYAPGAPSAISPTPSQTLTDTPTGTIQFTPLPTDTATDTPTATNIGVVFVSSASPTASSTRLPSATNAPPPAPTNVPTAANTPIPPTLTFTPSSTPITPTLTFTPSKTLTPTFTPSSTPTATFTPSSTPTATLTPIPCTIVQNLSDGAAPGPTGSLRAAIICANSSPGSIITFQTGLSGTITLNSGELVLTANMTITGPGAAQITVNAAGASRVLDLNSTGATVIVSGLTLTNGNVGTVKDGGNVSISTGNTLTLTNDVITGGKAHFGGGIYNRGSLTVQNTTISGNITTLPTAADGQGGGIYTASAVQVTITNSTLSGNEAGQGAAINNACCTVVVTNSTIVGNGLVGGSTFGGSVNLTGGTETFINDTVANNSGIGVYNDPKGTLNLGATIVAGNGTDVSGSIISQGFNLIGNTSGGSGFITSDLQNVSPNLGPLANNGGPTQTLALLSPSPAINYIPVGQCAVATDQRGVTRDSLCDIGAYEYMGAPTPTPIPCTIVQNLSDGAAPGPTGSLRAAISCAKPGDIITFNPSLKGTISLNSGELVIAKNLTINGLGAAIIKIDAKLASRVFNVQAGTVVISGLTITQGKDTTGKGGAITNAGSLTLNNVFITNSIETVFTGGGIDSNGPSLTLNSVTIDNNQAPSGAGIASINPLVITNSMITNNIVPAGGGVGGGLASYGTLTITGSTFMNNTAFGGGAMYLSASVKNISGTTIQNNTDKSTSLGGGAILTDANAQITLTNSTVSGNTTVAGSGGAFYVTAGSGSCSSLTVNSTVVSNNTAPSNSGGALYVTGGCSATIANGSQFKSNSAGGHGGAVSVNNGSVLIDTNSVLSNNSGDHGGAIDITAGSVTIDGASTISNNNSSSVGGGVYLPAAGNLTVKGKSIISGNVCNNTGGGISSAGSVLITGASQITGNSCDGGGGISSTGSLTVNGYSVISGNTAAFGGGGIDNGGTLIIDQSTIAGNKASTNGAGIRNFSGTLTMTASTVSGNQAFRSGGGVYNYTATAKITNSTISGNQAGTGGYSGGGIQDGDAGSTYINTNLTLLNDTIYNNSSSSPGANLYSNNINATMSTQSTIFADANGNGFADPDIAGYVSSQGYNLIQNPTGVSGFVGTDITNQDPNLYPLGNYRGSPLQTNPPRGGSPVIDVVPVTGANCPPTDEMQLARPVGSQCDIGAVEYNGLPPTPPPPPSSAPVLRPISATPSRTNTPTLTVTPTSTRTNTPIAPTASLTVTPIPRPATRIHTNTPVATSTAAHTPLLPTAVITATPFAPTGTLTITPTPISTLVGGEPS